MSDGQAISQWSGEAREQAVQKMFTAIARYYDLNNSLLSLGLHHRWKKTTVACVPFMEGGRALDLGAGTGDIALLLNPRLGLNGQVAALDLNMAMLRRGIQKISARGLTSRITCFQGNAEHLHFRHESFDVITAGFCIRNVGNISQAFSEIYRVLKPGGRFVCLEFSQPASRWIRSIYDWYSFYLLPTIGKMIARDKTDVYRYLPASIRNFPNQERLVILLGKAGFQHVEYRNLTGGIVAIHTALKQTQ